MFLRWLPWRYLARRAARAHGFLDPIELLAQIERFSQPSEVAAPFELLRAGAAFHARGLINARVIQHNLDWVWPYWVQRQYDPNDPSFLPRAFSMTHVNLSHRNWTAIGLPDCNALPIVAPRGLLTPFLDGWSLDAWVILDDGRQLLPSTEAQAEQELVLTSDALAVRTKVEQRGVSLTMKARVLNQDGVPVCRLDCAAAADGAGWLVLALRPFNPEGVSLVDSVALTPDRLAWRVNDTEEVRFTRPVEEHRTSTYHEGDVHRDLLDRPPSTEAVCRAGLATAAAMYRLGLDGRSEAGARIDLRQDRESAPVLPTGRPGRWEEALDGACRVEVPDDRFVSLYDAALRTLILHAPLDVYPGPYTYKRFWFRDAAFILHALLCAGLASRARRVLDRFPRRQRHDGYFLSQDGEWDSNGEALWIMWRYAVLTGEPPPASWHRPVVKGAQWIAGKRLGRSGALHDGLLPAGFSAEHLGNNDFYYWDDFWAVAGLRAAGDLCAAWADGTRAEEFRQEAASLLRDLSESVARSSGIRRHAGFPASPYRRMDAGAVGSLCGAYPLNVVAADDPRLLATTDYLLENCLVNGAFFQDMIHSGLNAYLTLHMAQVLLCLGDARSMDLMRRVAEMASPTGQWPEAVHPRTGGGCMGDGQHVWAAAEWVMMMRNIFVREEGGALVLASGIPREWLRQGSRLRLGPTPTPFGPVSAQIETGDHGVLVSWDGDWRSAPSEIRVCVPGYMPQARSATERSVRLSP